MQEFLTQLFENIGGTAINLIVAVLILVVGWIIALIVRVVVRRGVQRTRLDSRLGRLLGEESERVNIARWISLFFYYLILLAVLVAFLNALNLTVAAAPFSALLNQVLAFLPQLVGAIVLLIVAWIVATALRFITVQALKRLNVDQRISEEADLETSEELSMSNTVGSVVYWLIFLLFFPAILGVLGLQGLLGPVQGMVDELLGVIPNLISASLILLFGWVAARVVRQIVENLLKGVGVDRLDERVGVGAALGGAKISSVIALLVYVIILLPVAIAAVDALEFEAISAPASAMLTALLSAIPAILGAFVLIGVAYFLARVVGNFLTSVLTGLGFDNILSWIGLRQEPVEGAQTPSQIVGYLATIAIMLVAVIEAAALLGFTALSELVTDFLVGAGGVALGIVIFGIGLYLAALADRVIRGLGGVQARFLAPAARVVIIVFAGAIALRETGISEDIINLAFGLGVGAIALAAALAFGLGSRDIAARELEGAIKSVRKARKEE